VTHSSGRTSVRRVAGGTWDTVNAGSRLSSSRRTKRARGERRGSCCDGSVAVGVGNDAEKLTVVPLLGPPLADPTAPTVDTTPLGRLGGAQLQSSSGFRPRRRHRAHLRGADYRDWSGRRALDVCSAMGVGTAQLIWGSCLTAGNSR